jgi:hypothetical protein
MLPLSALSEMRPFIATPVYQNSVPGWGTSMFAMGGFFGKMGIEAQLKTVSQSIVTEARNALVMYFLQDPDATHFIFWDSDVHASVEECVRLLLADKNVVSGVCPLKTTPSDLQYPFKAIDGKLKVDADGFADVDWCTTGFMCVKREVFKRMIEEISELDYEPDRIAGDLERELKARRWYGFFSTMLLPGRKFIPEDYAFSHRWRSIGGEIWIDARSKLNHEGSYIFRGDFGRHLQEKHRSTLFRHVHTPQWSATVTGGTL